MDSERMNKQKGDFARLDVESDGGMPRNDRENLLPNGSQVDVYSVDDHMIGSVLSCIFCCTTIGLLAIVRSMQVRDYKVMGNTAMAQIAAKSAKKMTRLAVIFGLVGVVIMGLYFVGLFTVLMKFNQQLHQTPPPQQ